MATIEASNDETRPLLAATSPQASYTETDNVSESQKTHTARLGNVTKCAIALYGATSDAFGRKGPLLIAYCLFALGCVISTFLAQAVIVAVLFIVALSQSLPSDADSPSKPSKKKKRQLDVPGLLTFALTMAAFLLLVDRGSKDQPLHVVIILSVMTAAFAIAFLLIEKFWATSPLIPLSLLKEGGAGFNFAVQILVLVAQFGMLSNLASYFTRTENATNAVAALHILPAPFGNAIGALVGGKLISKYDPPLTFTSSVALSH
ncbi:MAG: hypothetical protein Q9220_005741 [cf. Caloplaca sp. 1 TL-2023]